MSASSYRGIEEEVSAFKDFWPVDKPFDVYKKHFRTKAKEPEITERTIFGELRRGVLREVDGQGVGVTPHVLQIKVKDFSGGRLSDKQREAQMGRFPYFFLQDGPCLCRQHSADIFADLS